MRIGKSTLIGAREIAPNKHIRAKQDYYYYYYCQSPRTTIKFQALRASAAAPKYFSLML